ncbi:MAG: DNA/RNA nuclease SfsA [Deltaproteobacteria bacterium]|nr:DNA/RNA nuclease SfsA [Deltaproteobacteria bacterium]
MKKNAQKNATGYLKWPSLIRGTLIKRYKRFMADVKLRNGHVVTAHCPNSGSMMECSEPGSKVYLSRHNNPKRKLKYTWEMIEMPSSLVGVNTMVPNRLVRASILAGKIPGLSGFGHVRPEVKYGENSRIDLLLEKGDERCFVEIKNCTLVTDSVACFPDAVTSRGLKHLKELQNQVRSGDRSVMFYLIQRMDAKLFRPADHIDPAYGKELRKAFKNGVEIMVYDVMLDSKGIRLNNAMPFELQRNTTFLVTDNIGL